MAASKPRPDVPVIGVKHLVIMHIVLVAFTIVITLINR